jgi:hypothetical protein
LSCRMVRVRLSSDANSISAILRYRTSGYMVSSHLYDRSNLPHWPPGEALAAEFVPARRDNPSLTTTFFHSHNISHDCCIITTSRAIRPAWMRLVGWPAHPWMLDWHRTIGQFQNLQLVCLFSLSHKNAHCDDQFFKR